MIKIVCRNNYKAYREGKYYFKLDMSWKLNIE